MSSFEECWRRWRSRSRPRVPARWSWPTFRSAVRSTRIGSVASITTLFKPSETVYVAVQTGAGKGVIGVRWKFGDKVVAEPTKPVDYNSGPKSTEFHLQNSGGFPPGDYSVDVLIDGVQVGSGISRWSRDALLLEIRRPVEDHGQRRARRLIDDGVDEEALAIGGDGVVSRVRRVRLGDLDVE